MMTGVHTYDLLRNTKYSLDHFQYFCAFLEDRHTFIVDVVNNVDNTAQSDLVRIVLNMAYLRRD